MCAHSFLLARGTLVLNSAYSIVPQLGRKRQRVLRYQRPPVTEAPQWLKRPRSNPANPPAQACEEAGGVLAAAPDRPFSSATKGVPLRSKRTLAPTPAAAHLDVLAQEEGTHVGRGGGGVRLQQLAGGNGFLVILLALPVVQQGLQDVQAVVHSPRAQQGSSRGAGDQGGRLQREAGDGRSEQALSSAHTRSGGREGTPQPLASSPALSSAKEPQEASRGSADGRPAQSSH